MKTRKLLVVCLVLVLALTLAFAAACNHEHKYTKWDYNGTQHWKVCPDDDTIDETSRASHSFGSGNKCECGATKSSDIEPDEPTWEHENHDWEWRHDATEHWKYCIDCDETDMSTYEAHSFGSDSKCECGATPHTEHDYSVWRYNGEGHWKACSICGKAESETVTPHVYNNKICECGAREGEEFKDTPVPTPGAEYVLTGDFAGGAWGDTSVAFTKEGSTYTVTQQFAVGQKWKVKKVGDANWTWQINFSTTKIITAADGVRGDVEHLLFTSDADNNFVCKYACTLTISHNGSTSSVNIRVEEATGVPADANLYTYTFHVYAPYWQGAYIHAWGSLFSTDWDSRPDMKSDGDGWYSYTVEVYEDKSNVTDQGVIMGDKGNEGNKVTMGGTDAGAGPAPKIATDMWFSSLKGNVQFNSQQEALNGSATSTLYTPVQVATLPPQNIVCKYALAA